MGDARVHWGLADALEDEFIACQTPVDGSQRQLHSDDPVDARV